MPIDLGNPRGLFLDWSSFGVRQPNMVGAVLGALFGGPLVLTAAYFGVGFAQDYLRFLFNLVG